MRNHITEAVWRGATRPCHELWRTRYDRKREKKSRKRPSLAVFPLVVRVRPFVGACVGGYRHSYSSRFERLSPFPGGGSITTLETQSVSFSFFLGQGMNDPSENLSVHLLCGLAHSIVQA
jgi:hypothetical protein